MVTTIGPRAALRFFTKRRNYKGSGAFLGGFVLVLVGWAVVGIAAQGYGAVLLFADFVPTALPFLRRVPILGSALQLPPVRAVRSPVRCAGLRSADSKTPAQAISRLVGKSKRTDGLPV